MFIFQKKRWFKWGIHVLSHHSIFIANSTNLPLNEKNCKRRYRQTAPKETLITNSITEIIKTITAFYYSINLSANEAFPMTEQKIVCAFCPNHMDKDYCTQPQDFSIAYRNTVCASYPNHKNENYYAQQKISLWLTETMLVLFTRTTWTRIITPSPRIFL